MSAESKWVVRQAPEAGPAAPDERRQPAVPARTPGAIVVLGAAGEGPAEIRARALAPFQGVGGRVVHWAEGPLAVALTPGPFRALHAGLRYVCLLDGGLYAHVGPGADQPPADPGARAEWLTAVYARTGDRLLTHLRGDFWMLVWDRERRQGLVACDQLGERAPFWARQDGRLVCASDLPELLAALPRRPEPDRLALAHWLMMTFPPAGATLYSGVRRLEAAHLLGLEAGASPRRYWSPTYREPRRPARAELMSEVAAALETAVARRLRDRPSAGRPTAGVLLSGGLDSSAVAVVAAGQRPGLTTYSAVFPHHPDVDESALIDLTTGDLRLPSTRIRVRDGSVLDGAVRYLRAWALPPTSPNLFFWAPLFERAAADGVSVMLDGEGGDEVFGFSPYLLADRLRSGRLPEALRLSARWPGARGRAPAWVLAYRLRAYGLRAASPPGAHLAMRRLRGEDSYAPEWLGPELRREWLASEESPFAFKRLDGPRWWTHLVHTTTRGGGAAAVLDQSRRRAAFAGLQARHPLFDADLLELVLGYDPELAFDRRFNRPLLRDAVAGRLHDDARLRQGKSFFDAVFEGALAGRDLTRARALLDPRQAELAACLDVRALHGLLFDTEPQTHPLGLSTWSLTVWRAVSAECWLRLQTGAGLPEVSSQTGEIEFETRPVAAG